MNISNNVAKTFRYDNRTEMFSNNVHSRGYDDPTYISFKLYFGDLEDFKYNNLLLTNMDMMPHPLFSTSEQDNIEYESGYTSESENGQADDPNSIVSTSNRTLYSTIDYLNDMNEFPRAEMLREFIKHWNDIQDNYQYYFQKIEGIQDLLSISTNRGSRIKGDSRLALTCLDAVDLRMTHLLNLYSKIAWDDTYQRWILPDIMRYFTLDIYISEFRTFHEPTTHASETNMSNPLSYVLTTAEESMPCIHLHCTQCEFDIESFEYGNLNTLDIGDPGEQHTVRFKIKVGNMIQKQIYPAFKRSAYLNEEDFNGRLRNTLQEKLWTLDQNGETDLDNETLLSASYAFRNGINILMADDIGRDGTTHGYDPYDNNYKGFIMPDSAVGLIESANAKGALHRVYNNNTWIGNMLTTAESAGRSIIKGYVDSFKMKPINIFGAKLPFSINELSSTFKGKDVRNLFDLARRLNKSVANDMIGGTVSPASSRLLVEQIESKYKDTNKIKSSIDQNAKIDYNLATQIYKETPFSESTNESEVEYDMGYLFKADKNKIDTPIIKTKGTDVNVFEIPQVNKAMEDVKSHFINMMQMYHQSSNNNATSLSQDAKENLKRSRESMDKSLSELAGIVSTATNLSPTLLNQLSDKMTDQILGDLKKTFSVATHSKIDTNNKIIEGTPSSKR